MNDIQLRDGLFELFPPDGASDWEDVLRRAASPRRVRRLTLLLAAAFLVVLAIGSALALSGRLGGLFHGTPVNDLTPREQFLMREFDMKGRVELIAQRGSTAFYVIRRTDGRLCYSMGEVRKHLTPAQREAQFRFGGGDCVDPRIFPSRAMPVLSHAFFSYRIGDSEASFGGLQGFAADAVEEIGVIGPKNQIAFTIPVADNVFSAGKKTVAGGRGIVALGKDGDVLWVQCFAIGRPPPAAQFPKGGCGRYKNSPPPVLPPSHVGTAPQPAQGPLVVQRGSGNGVSVVVHGPQVEARIRAITSTAEALLQGKRGKVNLTCFKLVKVAGREYSSGVGVPRDYGPVISARLGSLPGTTFTAPYDGCTLTGLYGRNWNDGHGTHDAVEVPLTPRGRRYFTERSVARDLTWLARAHVFYDIRYGVVHVDAAGAAQHLGGNVVALDGPQETPPVGKLGIWTGDDRRIVLVEQAPTGRRFYLDLRHGLIYKTNLGEF